jgi:uncharacterized protein (TIGR02757 family)
MRKRREDRKDPAKRGQRRRKCSMTREKDTLQREILEELYSKYNHRQFVHPDPLEFLYPYPDPRDREIVALIASCLAYGRVIQILRSVASVLERMNPSPHLFLMNASFKQVRASFSGFRHRFTGEEDLSSMLWAARATIEEHGSLQRCFAAELKEEDKTVLPALTAFVNALSLKLPRSLDGFLPCPSKRSACKRLHLFLRWMVRRDEVDPGGWDLVPASKLIVPLDTHMHRMGLVLRLTARKQADLQTAMEITNAFRKVAPHDPVKYDFALTRLGIRDDLSPQEFFAACGVA